MCIYIVQYVLAVHLQFVGDKEALSTTTTTFASLRQYLEARNQVESLVVKHRQNFALATATAKVSTSVVLIVGLSGAVS